MSDTSPTQPGPIAASATMLSDRAVIRVAGDDPRGFLQGLLTQDVGAVAPDRPLWAGLLSPQGKALFDMVLWDGGEGAVLIDAEATRAELLTRRLAMYRLRRAITLEASDARIHWAREGDQGVADPRLPELGRRWLGGASDAAEGWRAHRLSLGVAEGVDELGDGDTLWLEANAAELGGVSFAKGCYVGQENTARMHYRAKVNRRLVVVPADADDARITYPDLGRAVARRRSEALGDALVPAWLAYALAADQRPTAT